MDTHLRFSMFLNLLLNSNLYFIEFSIGCYFAMSEIINKKKSLLVASIFFISVSPIELPRYRTAHEKIVRYFNFVVFLLICMYPLFEALIHK